MCCQKGSPRLYLKFVSLCQTYLVILANNYILCIEKLLVFLIADIIATVKRFLMSNKRTTIEH